MWVRDRNVQATTSRFSTERGRFHPSLNSGFIHDIVKREKRLAFRAMKGLGATGGVLIIEYHGS